MQIANWVSKELEGVALGDNRLNKRCRTILSKLASNPSKSIPGSFKSWKETIAAYRFFNQEKVRPEGILSPHYKATLNRIKGEKIVLIAQDTTEIDFSGRKPIEGMGYLSSERSQGFYVHSGLALTPERVCLGVIDTQLWSRRELGSRKLQLHRKKAIEEKESYCWLKGYEAANAIAQSAPETCVVSIADREGDIYELLEKLPSETNKAFWLVRCQHNRLLSTDCDEKQRLWDWVSASNPVGEIEYMLPNGKIYNREESKRSPRKRRLVKQEVRLQTVRLKSPERRNGKKLTPIAIHVVHCKEINAPSEEDKLEWFLLTSLPINDAETALELVRWYLVRWQIELFFKILKSGCKIEELQFDSLEATSNCLAIYMLVAWRILYLTMLGRNCPDIDCDLVFEDSEWKSVFAIVKKKKPPAQVPKLNEMIIMIARLGGFLGRKSDGFPGCKVMWIGMQRMTDFALAWETFHSVAKQSYV